MEELNIGDRFRTNLSGYKNKWFTITDKITSQAEANRRLNSKNSSFNACLCYYEYMTDGAKKKQLMGHGCDIQNNIIELVRNTIINNYAIY